jgi:hypothetical protein
VTHGNRDVIKTLREGDYVVTYVKETGFADVRCIIDTPTSGGGNGTGPGVIVTKPMAIIDLDDHLPGERLTRRLSFVTNSDRWRDSFRQSLRLIPEEDGLFLDSLIVATAKAKRATMQSPPRLIANDEGFACLSIA